MYSACTRNALADVTKNLLFYEINCHRMKTEPMKTEAVLYSTNAFPRDDALFASWILFCLFCLFFYRFFCPLYNAFISKGLIKCDKKQTFFF